ncbi:MAG: GTPase HflX [Amoebophilaceae bacterium]|nr:GTPase HflX [Amoebophilaceae bacterium]
MIEPPKTGVTIAVITDRQSITKTEEYVHELSFLARTWGLEIVKNFAQRLQTPHGATFIGKGKVEEIAAFIKANHIGYAVFDDELSPSQVRNLEKLLACQILDRNLLIFNIFSMRAKTKRAKTQIELAQYQYVLPRLTRMWSHLTSQKGGSAGMRGPGEKELETDKRIIQDKISLLRRRLADIEKQCATRTKSRLDFVRVSLVGYTNVGKSTLMKLLSKFEVLCEDKLFATLDATVRKIVLHGNAFLLTDTIGFIRKLPHTLVECFKSTLAEIKEADLLLHIIDVSHPRCREQIKVVSETLKEIGAGDKPMIFIFNKVDLASRQVSVKEGESDAIQETEAVDISALEEEYKDIAANHLVSFISATDGLHLDLFKEMISKEIEKLQAKKYIKHTY